MGDLRNAVAGLDQRHGLLYFFVLAYLRCDLRVLLSLVCEMRLDVLFTLFKVDKILRLDQPTATVILGLVCTWIRQLFVELHMVDSEGVTRFLQEGPSVLLEGFEPVCAIDLIFPIGSGIRFVEIGIDFREALLLLLVLDVRSLIFVIEKFTPPAGVGREAKRTLLGCAGTGTNSKLCHSEHARVVSVHSRILTLR